MKKTHLFLVLFALIISSCQQDSGLFSFNNQKKQICKEWKLVSGTDTTSIFTDYDTTTIINTYTDSTMYQSVSYIPATVISEYSELFSFYDDNTFTSKNIQKTTDFTYTTISSGTWNFVSKDENFKKNERIAINTTSISTGTSEINVNELDTLLVVELSDDIFTIKSNSTTVETGMKIIISGLKTYN